MRQKNIVFLVIATLLIAAVTWLAYKALFSSPQAIFFKTKKPEKRDIYKIVLADGSLGAYESSKLGPLITAKVKKIYVSEGQSVAQGMLLADLENDKGGDTDVRLTKAQLEKAQATFMYVAARHKRDESLFQLGELADDAFEKSIEMYKSAQADVAIRQAAYDKEVYLFEQTQVRAPHDGIVAGIGIEEGETVSPGASPPKVLFTIVQDLKTMKATLLIDESKVGDVKVGMQAEISVDTYPYRQPWVGSILNVAMSKAEWQGENVLYKAIALIDNSEGLLRPGMTVHAKALIAQANQVLTVPGFVFQLNGKVLQAIAKKKGYACTPLDKAQKKEFAALKSKNPIKTLWVLKAQEFIEKAVEIGINDNAYFEIISGIDLNDDIIVDDMTASDEMKKIARQIAGN